MISLNKTVLVTGAGGFIGLNTVKALSEAGYKITAMVHKNVPDELYRLPDVKVVRADMTDEVSVMSAINGQNTDIVVHIAGLASDIGSDETFRKINFEPIKFFSQLSKEKFIYISSTDVYGIKDFSGEDETLEFEKSPVNPYPKYKIEAEKWMRDNLNPSKFVIIRPAAVWGEGDKTLENRVVEFLEVSPFIIHFGKWKGKNRWPLANVKNVAAVIAAVCETDDYNGQAVNIIDEKFTTIDEYYRETAAKYFPGKKFYTLNLPVWLGLCIGWISTTLANFLQMKKPLFDPTLYSVRHVASNLDFDGSKMKEIIKNHTADR